MGDGRVIHANAIRVRVVGSGNMRCTFQGFNDILTQTLLPIDMTATDSRLKMRLANFQSQAIKLRGETTSINEVMRVNDITFFIRPLWAEYPQ